MANNPESIKPGAEIGVTGVSHLEEPLPSIEDVSKPEYLEQLNANSELTPLKPIGEIAQQDVEESTKKAEELMSQLENIYNKNTMEPEVKKSETPENPVKPQESVQTVEAKNPDAPFEGKIPKAPIIGEAEYALPEEDVVEPKPEAKKEEIATAKELPPEFISPEMKAKKENEIMNKEWENFSKLTEKQKKVFETNLSYNAGDRLVKGGIKDTESLKYMLMLASKNKGITNPDAVYGLLAQGYKPHETKGVGFSDVMIPGEGMKSAFRGTEKQFEDFLKKIATDFNMGVTKRPESDEAIRLRKEAQDAKLKVAAEKAEEEKNRYTYMAKEVKPEEIDKKLLEKYQEGIQRYDAREKSKSSEAVLTETKEKGQEQKPWEQLTVGQKVAEKYFEAISLSLENKKQIEETLQGEIRQTQEKIAKEWFEKNGTKGVQLSKEAIMASALNPKTKEFSAEVLKYIEANKDLYKGDLLKIENAEALRAEFKNDNVSPESQFLMLGHLEKRSKELAGQIEKLKASGGLENIKKGEELQQEIDKLFEVRKELTEKTTGRDLEKETIERVAQKLGYNSKEEYMNNKELVFQEELKARKEKAIMLAEKSWDELGPIEKAKYKGGFEEFKTSWQERGMARHWWTTDRMNYDQFNALTDAGYKIKEGFFAKYLYAKPSLVGSDGKETKMSFKEIRQYAEACKKVYDEKISQSVKAGLERRWNQEETGAIINEITTTMEEAVGGTEAAYARLKEKLIQEMVGAPIKEKTPPEQAKQDKDFGKQEKKYPKLSELLKDIVTGKFDKLTGDEANYKEILGKISNDYDLGFTPRALERVTPDAYKKAVKTNGGILFQFAQRQTKKLKTTVKNTFA